MHKCKEQLGCSGDNITTYSQHDELEFEQCEDCGIIWRSKASAHITKSYEQNYFDSKKYSNKRKHKVKKSGWLIDLARLHHPDIKQLLEVGCSIGYTLEAAQKRDIDHLGIDVSEYAVDYCQNLGLNAQNSTFKELKQDGHKYDLIYMQHVLEHFENPFKRLEECHALLNDKGLILIMVPNSEYKRAVKLNSDHRFYNIKGVGAEHYAYFNYSSLKAVVKASGFEVLQENYPLIANNQDSLEFFANRLYRRLLSAFNMDQEILLIARKVNDGK